MGLAIESRGGGEGLPYRTFDLQALGLALLNLHTGANLLHFVNGVLRVVGSNPFQTLPGLVVSSLLGKPAGALLECEHADAKKRCGK